MRFVVSYKTKFGEVSAESTKPQDLVRAYRDLKEIAREISADKHSKNTIRRKSQTRAMKSAKLKRLGSGETAKILREIESKILITDFFSNPRSTGDTRAKLEKLGKSFASRKVSQALGILRKKNILKRTGSKNHFRYWR